MKKVFIMFASLSLVLPFLFFGCSGDDGAQGPSGTQGIQGPAGPPGTGVTAQETCTLCHENTVKVHDVHRLADNGAMLTAGTATITINTVTFGAPVGDNVPVTVNFTFNAVSSAGADITSQIDLRTRTGNPPGPNDNLAYLGFAIAQLVPGTNGSSNEWNGFIVNPTGTGSSPFRTNRPDGVDGAVFTGTPATGVYTYTFPTSAVRVQDGYLDNMVTRVAIQFTTSPSAATPALQATLNLFTTDPILQQSLNRPVANGILDVVNPVGGGVGTAPTAAYPTKNVVTTAACNQCHDPLAIHGGSRRDTRFCQVCHSLKAETQGNIQAGGPGWDNLGLVRLVHGIHSSFNLGNTNGVPAGAGDFREVTFPQDIRNCTTCHQGGTDSDNWKNKPTRRACGSCHTGVNFATGVGHGPGNVGGIRTDDSQCFICHTPEGIAAAMADPNTTPGNVPAGLDNIVYFIDNVTVDNNVPVVGFHITKNGAPMDLSTFPPTGYSSATTPSFLVAYTLPQDGITAPADYNNKGKAAAQPASVSIQNLASSLTGGPSGYTARLTAAPFPPGSTLRAVAIQGYFTQNNADITGDGVNDNVARHAKSEVKAVGTARRTVVDTNKCLSCHKTLELHGGSRVNNVQVCVMCHNPNLSSSGRTTPTPVTGFTVEVGTLPAGFNTNDPLSYPERTNDFKELVHGIHGGDKRGAANPYTFVRLRGVARYFDWSEVTYPAQERNCTKCHINGTFDADLPAGVLLVTEETFNGTFTRDGIIAARTSVPNAEDLVNSPTASVCGFCHADDKARSHFVLQGGKIKVPRGTALLEPNPLSITFTPAP
jgi:OmcA/MtrC family decaheme c-type cytochrome